MASKGLPRVPWPGSTVAGAVDAVVALGGERGAASVHLDFRVTREHTGEMDDSADTVAGDAACWLPRVCEQCGALVEGELPAPCWRCGVMMGGEQPELP
ncbi:MULTISPECIES: hypothetical protein [unclassified Salinibacterium]|uniref:hypothetical protein n=1 Tax=unclassified Salinibacterium TaxID=2632331 RepID=UPI0018CE2BBA|nr:MULTISPECIES: hypothetical protein [unclassified Salinibacterium]MBH0053504.1 hypothetical protein [Salinibacterium sp. SWN139]MBH0082772.1 hypothetical protein [Salinibacterium sp. SWN167]